MKKNIAFINPRLTTANVGDFFIDDSVKRIIDYNQDGSIDIDPRRELKSSDIDRINEMDVAVIVGTNLWYRTILCHGRWTLTTDQLNKIKIPVVPLGVGTTRHKGEDDSFDKESLEILRTVHDKCLQGSARDPRTLEALEKAGVRNAVMTGCPTLYRSLEPNWKLNIKQTRDIVVTVRKGQKSNVRRLIACLNAEGWKTTIAAQQDKDTYFRRKIPFVQQPVPTLYEYDISPYKALVDSAFGVIGWRLHGNMLHLAAGNPAIFFANCSRAESFCEAFRLPCFRAEDGEIISRREIEEAVSLLKNTTSFGPFVERYRHYYMEMASFLEINGLAHNLRFNDTTQ